MELLCPVKSTLELFIRKSPFRTELLAKFKKIYEKSGKTQIPYFSSSFVFKTNIHYLLLGLNNQTSGLCFWADKCSGDSFHHGGQNSLEKKILKLYDIWAKPMKKLSKIMRGKTAWGLFKIYPWPRRRPASKLLRRSGENFGNRDG